MKLHSLRFLVLGLLVVAAAFAADPRKKLVMLISEPEYDTARTLPEFATKFLEKDFRVVTVPGAQVGDENSFTGMNELADADVVLVSVRRRTPPQAQLDAVRAYLAAGKPLVGIRTASHAFALAKNQKLTQGGAAWPEWDAEVIGGSYTNHHGRGTLTTVTAAAANDPLLRGVKLPFESTSSLYKVSPLRTGAHAILTGTIPGQPPEPIAWTFQRRDGGKSFYTTLGAPDDFKHPSFTTLLRNALLWAAKK